MATQGNYDHPTYLTRQMVVMDVSSAGANGTSASMSFPLNMRLRSFASAVRVAGTSATSGTQQQLIYIGTSVQGFTLSPVVLTTNTTTATLGFVNQGTGAAGTVVLSTDVDALLVAGGLLAVKNGTDATGTAKNVLEIYVDPSATWTGPPGN